MATWTLKQLAAKMRGLDIAMLSTVTAYGHIASRPMSNNGEVEYDGTSYFFTWAESRMAKDIAKNNNVSVEFQGGKDFLFVQVQGKASVLTSKASMRPHWHPELERWFTDGLDTDGLVMLKVDATRIAYWSGDGDGLITV